MNSFFSDRDHWCCNDFFSVRLKIPELVQKSWKQKCMCVHCTMPFIDSELWSAFINSRTRLWTGLIEEDQISGVSLWKKKEKKKGQSHLLDVVQPLADIVEWLLICDVIHKHNTLQSTQYIGGQTTGEHVSTTQHEFAGRGGTERDSCGWKYSPLLPDSRKLWWCGIAPVRRYPWKSVRRYSANWFVPLHQRTNVVMFNSAANHNRPVLTKSEVWFSFHRAQQSWFWSQFLWKAKKHIRASHYAQSMKILVVQRRWVTPSSPALDTHITEAQARTRWHKAYLSSRWMYCWTRRQRIWREHTSSLHHCLQ